MRKAKRERHANHFLSVGNVLIVVGLLLVAAALALFGYNWWDSIRAGREADEVVRELDAEPDVADGDSSGNGLPTSGSSETETEAPTKTVDGTRYVGVLDIPALGVKLPVANEWDYSQLRISPCRYTGSYLTDDLVICGHNYPSHFRGLLGIDIGADVYLDAADGSRIHYVVSNRETVQPTSIEQMVENDRNSENAADWDLTLFTCNLGGQTRCAVRCVRS